MNEHDFADATSTPFTSPGLDAELPAGVDLAGLDRLCVHVATRAARFIRDERPAGVGVEATKSTDTDVVTVMDRRCEELLHRLLHELRPDDGILGEEGAHRSGTSGLTWVLDPIDGTVNYLYEVPAYAVSVAVVVGDPTTEGAWRPVAGAVADPSLRLVHHAHRGGGAWTHAEGATAGTDGRRLAVSTERRLGRTLLATGFGSAPEIRARQAEVLTRVLPAVRDIRRIGSAALDLVRVAEGSVDAYAESGLNAWDLAAGWLVVEEAGGVVGGATEGSAPGKMLTLAAGPALVGPVRELFTA
jgi:myo-inositol-1(or 4)-monophosphatase